MKAFKLTLVASLFAAGAIAGNLAWAERGNAHFDRVYPTQRFPIPSPDRRGRDHGHHAWGWGLGLLAGTAILLAATEPRTVVGPPPVRVYIPPPVAYPPPAASFSAYSEPTAQWWYYCARAASYYPYVRQCPSGWTRVPVAPPG